MQSPLTQLGLVVMTVLFVVAACADGTDDPSTTTQPRSSPADGSSGSQPTDGAASTVTTSDLTVERVIAWITSFSGQPLSCEETGPVAVGDVFACGGSSTVPTSTLVEHGGTVIYVLDESGRAAWTSGTDVPGPTGNLLRVYERVPKGLFCQDLLSPEIDAFPFSGNSSSSKLAYFWSLVYWSLEGRPDRMDADLDGIPCGTLYETDVIDDVLAGGPAEE